MATIVTSLDPSEPQTVNVRAGKHGCRFAQVAVANLQPAGTFSQIPLTVGLHGGFVDIQVVITMPIPAQTRLVQA